MTKMQTSMTKKEKKKAARQKKKKKILTKTNKASQTSFTNRMDKQSETETDSWGDRRSCTLIASV